MRFVEKKGVMDRIPEAIAQYCGTSTNKLDELELDQEEVLGFTEWFIHDFVLPDHGLPPITAYLKSNPRLSPEERQILEDWQQTNLSVYQVREIAAGHGVHVEDIFSEEKFFFHDTPPQPTPFDQPDASPSAEWSQTAHKNITEYVVGISTKRVDQISFGHVGLTPDDTYVVRVDYRVMGRSQARPYARWFWLDKDAKVLRTQAIWLTPGQAVIFDHYPLRSDHRRVYEGRLCRNGNWSPVLVHSPGSWNSCSSYWGRVCLVRKSRSD
jgi:hypothetical protein